MYLQLTRICTQRKTTIGALFSIDRKQRFLCFTLEPGYRSVKIPGETRIPAGSYPLQFKTHGEKHEEYLMLNPDKHIGMLELIGVPDFTDILFHVGNFARDTKACILLGIGVNDRMTELSGSWIAYHVVYDLIALRLKDGKNIWIEIKDFA